MIEILIKSAWIELHWKRNYITMRIIFFQRALIISCSTSLNCVNFHRDSLHRGMKLKPHNKIKNTIGVFRIVVEDFRKQKYRIKLSQFAMLIRTWSKIWEISKFPTKLQILSPEDEFGWLVFDNTIQFVASAKQNRAGIYWYE